MTFLTCVTFLTLKMEYQKHLRIWGELEFGAPGVSNTTDEREHLEAKRAALESRRVLREYMVEHQQLCITCQEHLDALRRVLLKGP
jgi:hypothetical protein